MAKNTKRQKKRARVKAAAATIRRSTRAAVIASMPPVAPALPAEGFIRLPVVLAHVALGKSTLWEMVRQQKFPPPIRLSERNVGWNVLDVRNWIANRIAAATGSTAT